MNLNLIDARTRTVLINLVCSVGKTYILNEPEL